MANHSIIIYTRLGCPYCVWAKELIEKEGFSYTEIRIDLEPNRREEMIKKSAGRTTVPQIFIDGKHIGGCDDLYALYEQKGSIV